MGAATTDPDIHHVHHDEDERLSETLVAAVAALDDTSPDDLPPLDARINVAALDRLWETDGADRPSAGCLTFTYAGYVVVARSTGVVFLRDADTGGRTRSDHGRPSADDTDI
jgi:hypothetical protein